MIIAKIVITIVFVLGLSFTAEYGSPKFAGFISGYPLGMAITLFFYGLEQGPEFAAHSALYAMIGLTAMLAFVYLYYLGSTFSKRYSIPWAVFTALSGFFLVSWLLRFIRADRGFSILIPVAAIIVSTYLFRRIDNTAIGKRVSVTPSVLIFRSMLSAGIILSVIGMSGIVGSAWAGLFSAFPATVFPLILIIHYTYDVKHVHTIIKNFPAGTGSLVFYALTVSMTYPRFGVYMGTLSAYAVATAYMILYRKIIEPRLAPAA